VADKETLVVIVGAGASIMPGISSTKDLTRVSKRAMPTITIPGIAHSVPSGLTMKNDVPILMADVLDQGLRSDFGSDYDFEILLGALEELETFVGRRYNPHGRSDVNIPALGSFAELMQRFRCLDDDSLIRETRLSILTAIHSKIASDCDYPAAAHIAMQARQQVERMFKLLGDKFRLIVIDFNYDDLIDRIPIPWHDGYTTRDATHFCQLFNPEDWYKQIGDPAANLLIHVHGSVKFGYNLSPGSDPTLRFAEPPKFDLIAGATQSIPGRGVSGTTVDGRNADAAFIISGINKAGKVTYNARPYGYYFSAASQFLAQTNKLLVLGYGWRDIHINTWVNEYVSLHSDRKTAVVTYRPGASVGEYTMENRGLSRLADAAIWSKIENRAFARTSVEKTRGEPSRLCIEGGFAIAPDGFIMDAKDESDLLGFVTT
jgi:hypothetical protein